MPRQTTFGKLAALAGKIDALNARADVVARKLTRARNPVTVEQLSTEGLRLERSLRRAEGQYGRMERPYIRERAPRGVPKVPSAVDVPSLVKQTFTVRGTYRRKNHRLSVEIQLSHIGIPQNDEQILNAVQALARGHQPTLWTVTQIEYGRTALQRRVRGADDLHGISGAIAAMRSTGDLVVGEHE